MKAKKKVGIITLFHNNVNYGGLLQAYALTRYINSADYDCEQIRTSFITANDRKLIGSGKGIKNLIKSIVKFVIYIFIKNKLAARRRAFAGFEEKIPHSEAVYDSENIKRTNEIYDFFITGSDQVWNMSWYRPEYFLSFVENKPKISYAASMPARFQSSSDEIIANHLRDFSSISVREQELVEKISGLSGKEAVQTVDSTLLFSAKEWDEVCDGRIIDEPYLICYFLSTNRAVKKYISEFAKKKRMKIVILPHVGGINISDCFFGDMRLYDISPSQFVSLIKYADYVLTDSFHASVFSCIYKKKFVVFSRRGGERMNSRLHSLLKLYSNTDRFAGTIAGAAELEEKLENCAAGEGSLLQATIDESKRFIEKSLSVSEEDRAYEN